MAAGDIHAHMVLPTSGDKIKRTGPAILGATAPGSKAGEIRTPTTGKVA